MRYKKGLSSVIVSVLFVTIALVSAVIIGGILLTIVKAPNLAPALSCTDWQTQPPLQIQSACVRKSEREDIELTLVRLDERTVVSFTVGLLNEQQHFVASWNCGEICGTCTILVPQSTRTYYFDSTELTVREGHQIQLEMNGCIIGRALLTAC